MPSNPYWKQYRESGKPMVCMTDNSTTTILQFIEKQLVNKRITNDDYSFLFNRTANRQPGDASINGVAVSQPNIRCSNGFIHELAEVATPVFVGRRHAEREMGIVPIKGTIVEIDAQGHGNTIHTDIQVGVYVIAPRRAITRA
jgi:hypothetical protein